MEKNEKLQTEKFNPSLQVGSFRSFVLCINFPSTPQRPNLIWRSASLLHSMNSLPQHGAWEWSSQKKKKPTRKTNGEFARRMKSARFCAAWLTGLCKDLWLFSIYNVNHWNSSWWFLVVFARFLPPLGSNFHNFFRLLLSTCSSSISTVLSARYVSDVCHCHCVALIALFALCKWEWKFFAAI